ncbi:MAG: exosortase system-associated protein, TIGR04073 family [Candidatus Omnitrophica bacterium]|nr:exosortase system-associated protein, TIGR04073 family [Candidatus Omnitrophota bacterium]
MSHTAGRTTRLVSLLAVITAFLAVAATAAAADDPNAAEATWPSRAGRKLGRGAANILTGPLELFRTPYLVSQRDGGVAGVTVGVVHGCGAFIVREIAGALEVLTFPVGIPRADFSPLVRPEFVYAHGDWTPNP